MTVASLLWLLSSEPVRAEVAGRKIKHVPQWGTWFYCDCTFDEPALRRRLNLPDFITFEEYDGRVAGSDATFYCPRGQRAIMGRHPNYASATTPRLA